MKTLSKIVAGTAVAVGLMCLFAPTAKAGVAVNVGFNGSYHGYNVGVNYSNGYHQPRAYCASRPVYYNAPLPPPAPMY